MNVPSLYIHIPFCRSKCFYCSFVVSVGQEKRMAAYVEALNIEASQYRGSKIKSVFIGGGTPTWLTTRDLARLFAVIHDNFKIVPNCEWTIEANPEGLDEEKLKLIQDSGIDRISLGIQTFNDSFLKYLGRNHDTHQAVTTFRILRQSGFKNVNVDLMFGFPNQGKDQLRQDLDKLIALDPDHVSLYSLTIEANSRFHARHVALDDSEFLAEMYSIILEYLSTHGFEQYEVSNFAKPGKASAHNMNYWQGGNYIGLGIGAHAHQNGRRWWNIARLTEYIEKLDRGQSVIEGEENLSTQERFIEKLIFGLRMNQGVDLVKLENEFACKLDSERNVITRRMIQEGLLIQKGTILQATPRGRLVLDSISTALI